MTRKLKQGTKVKWKVGSGETTGQITQKITKSTEVNGRKFNATKNKPRYLVKTTIRITLALTEQNLYLCWKKIILSQN